MDQPKLKVKLLKWVKNPLSLDLFLVFYLTMAARYAVSVDGALYLSSAKSLFSPNFPFLYHHVREPLFPLMLRLVHVVFGNSDLAFVFVQSVILIAVLRIVSRRFFRKNLLFQNLLVSLVSCNTVTIGYVGTVLQQVLFVIVLLLIAYWAFGAIDGNLSDKQVIIEGALIGTLAASLSVLFLPALVTVCISVFVIRLTRERKAKNLKNKMHIISVAAIVPLLFSLIFTSAWSAFKYEQLKSNPNPAYPAWILQYGSSGPANYPAGRSKNMAIWSLLNIKDDLMAPGVRENVIYGMGITGERCGGGISQIPSPNFEYTGNYFEMSCKAPWAYNLARHYFKISFWTLTITLILAMALTAFGLFFRNSKLIISLLPGVTLILFYWTRGAGISRYGFPVIGVATLGILVWCDYIYEKFKLRN